MADTNYKKAWQEFQATSGYKKCISELRAHGIYYPYADHILRTAFESGWNATGTKIEFISTDNKNFKPKIVL